MEYRDSEYRSHFPVRIPLFWILFPMAAGMGASGWLPLPGPLACFALGIASLLGAAFALGRSWWVPAWHSLFPLGVFLLGASHGLLNNPTGNPLEAPWSERPPREAHLTLAVHEVYQPGEGDRSRVSGLARIAYAEPHLRELQGRLIYFSLWHDHPQPVIPTSRLETVGVLEVLSPAPTEPIFERDFEAFLRQKGVSHRLGRGHVTGFASEGTPLRRWNQRQNRRFIEILDAPDIRFSEGNNTWKAMLLGQTRFLTPELRDAFRHSGTMHLFAISGLHIGIIAAIIGFTLRRCGVPLARTPLLGLPLLFLFVQITGSSPSAVRAFLMIAFFWSAFMILRRPVPLSAWTASAIAVLLLQPVQLWNPGFQLSYAVVAMILLYGLPLAQFLQHRLLPWRRIPPHLLEPHQKAVRKTLRVLLDSFAISLSAFLISQPIALFYFGIFSPISVFLNVFLVLLAFPVILLGMMTLCLGLVLPAIVLLPLQWIAGGILEFMAALIQAALRLPGSSMVLPGSHPLTASLGVTVLLAIPLLARLLFKRADHPLGLLLPPACFLALLPLML